MHNGSGTLLNRISATADSKFKLLTYFFKFLFFLATNVPAKCHWRKSVLLGAIAIPSPVPGCPRARPDEHDPRLRRLQGEDYLGPKRSPVCRDRSLQHHLGSRRISGRGPSPIPEHEETIPIGLPPSRERPGGYSEGSSACPGPHASATATAAGLQAWATPARTTAGLCQRHPPGREGRAAGDGRPGSATAASAAGTGSGAWRGRIPRVVGAAAGA